MEANGGILSGAFRGLFCESSYWLGCALSTYIIRWHRQDKRGDTLANNNVKCKWRMFSHGFARGYVPNGGCFESLCKSWRAPRWTGAAERVRIIGPHPPPQ